MRLVVLGVAATVLAGVPASAEPSARAESIYVVRPDPRLCPSPLCGGYWVASANRARTLCHDGLRRPRCYVASADAAVPDGALVRARVVPRAFGGTGTFGILAVSGVRAPVGERERGAYYAVRDLGIRCVRAPCFHLRVGRLNGPARRVVSSMDLASFTRASESQLRRAEIAATSANGLWVLGRVVETADAGHILQASRFYLRAP